MKNLFGLVCLALAGCSSDAASVAGADLSGVPFDTSVDMAHAAGPAHDLAGVDLAGTDLAHPADAAPAPADGAPAPTGPYLFPAVWTILMENHDRQTMLTSTDAMYIQQLASMNAQAASYTTLGSPSLQNYLEMTCGCASSHQLIGKTDTPVSLLLIGINNLFSDTSLGGQLQTAGVPWRAYTEDTTAGSTLGNCQSGDTGHYVARHVPFLYFKDVYGSGTSADATCTQRVRVFGDHTAKTGDFYDDLKAGTYPYQWITPDLIDDMHDGTIADGNAWLMSVVPEIQKTAAYQAGGVIFILWDEGSSTSDQALFIAISKRARVGYQSPTAYTHTNFLATIEDIFKLARVGDAVGAPNMMELFTP